MQVYTSVGKVVLGEDARYLVSTRKSFSGDRIILCFRDQIGSLRIRDGGRRVCDEDVFCRAP